jgi:hypothetical protein
VNRRPACEARRKLDERLGDEHGDRVRVAGSDVEAEPLRFERDGTATRERVEHWRRPVGARDEDLLLGLVGVLGAISGMFGMADYLWATGCPGLHGTEGYAPLHHEHLSTSCVCTSTPAAR